MVAKSGVDPGDRLVRCHGDDRRIAAGTGMVPPLGWQSAVTAADRELDGVAPWQQADEGISAVRAGHPDNGVQDSIEQRVGHRGDRRGCHAFA